MTSEVKSGGEISYPEQTGDKGKEPVKTRDAKVQDISSQLPEITAATQPATTTTFKAGIEAKEVSITLRQELDRKIKDIATAMKNKESTEVLTQMIQEKDEIRKNLRDFYREQDPKGWDDKIEAWNTFNSNIGNIRNLKADELVNRVSVATFDVFSKLKVKSPDYEEFLKKNIVPAIYYNIDNFGPESQSDKQKLKQAVIDRLNKRMQINLPYQHPLYEYKYYF